MTILIQLRAHSVFTRLISATKSFHASTMSLYPLKQRLDKLCCRSQHHTCSIGLNLGEYGESFIILRLAISSVCQPKPSIITTACLSGSVRLDIKSRCCCIISLLTQGAINASVSPVAAHTAPNK